MAIYSPKEMAVFLRRCGNEICDDSCPCAGMDGDCGGFNLYWAWASGYLAGRLGR